MTLYSTNNKKKKEKTLTNSSWILAKNKRMTILSLSLNSIYLGWIYFSSCCCSSSKNKPKHILYTFIWWKSCPRSSSSMKKKIRSGGWCLLTFFGGIHRMITRTLMTMNKSSFLRPGCPWQDKIEQNIAIVVSIDDDDDTKRNEEKWIMEPWNKTNVVDPNILDDDVEPNKPTHAILFIQFLVKVKKNNVITTWFFSFVLHMNSMCKTKNEIYRFLDFFFFFFFWWLLHTVYIEYNHHEFCEFFFSFLFIHFIHWPHLMNEWKKREKMTMMTVFFGRKLWFTGGGDERDDDRLCCWWWWQNEKKNVEQNSIRKGR